MTARTTQPAPSLRDRIAAALRNAAHRCGEDCPAPDPEHQAALDRLMPAEPMPTNQPELPTEEPRP